MAPEVNIHVNDGAFGPRNLLLLPRRKEFPLIPQEIGWLGGSRYLEDHPRTGK